MKALTSERGFRLVLAGCVAATVIMIAAVHVTTGLRLGWNSPPGMEMRPVAAAARTGA